MRLNTPRRGVTARVELTWPRIPACGRGRAQARGRRTASRIMPAMMRSCVVAGARGGGPPAPRPPAGGGGGGGGRVPPPAPAALAQSPDASDWGYYGGDAFGQRFSSLDEINRANVSKLSVPWTHRPGDPGG